LGGYERVVVKSSRMIMREATPPLSEIGKSWDLLPTQTERLLGLRRELILALAEADKVRISVLRIPGRKREYLLVSLADLVACIESSVRSASEIETEKGGDDGR
jgi:hypothetical protein